MQWTIIAMVRSRAGAAIAQISLLALSFAGGACHSTARGDQELWLPYAHQGELWRVRASGRDAQLLRTKTKGSGYDADTFDAWFAPDLDPVTDRIACVRIVRWTRGTVPSESLGLDQWHEVVLLEPEADAATDRVLYRTRFPIGELAFAPDGGRLALIQDRRQLVVLDVEGGQGNTLVVNGKTQLEAGDRYLELAWEADGQHLLVFRRSRSPRLDSIGRLALDTDEPAFEALATWTEPRAPAEVRRARGVAEAWSRLFGPSPASSPLRPDFHVTRDTRFGFRVAKEEGLFARGWIEGYDAETDTTFEVCTLWRSLYAE